MRTKNFIFLLVSVILLSLLLIIFGPENTTNITNIQNLANQQFKQIKVSFTFQSFFFLSIIDQHCITLVGKSSRREGE